MKAISVAKKCATKLLNFDNGIFFFSHNVSNPFMETPIESMFNLLSANACLDKYIVLILN